METDETWKKILICTDPEIKMKLVRGGEFVAKSNVSDNEIIVTPKKSGISRRISWLEWSRFVEKYNEIERSGYDPLRPGHYAKVSFNSSYIVAILKMCA